MFDFIFNRDGNAADAPPGVSPSPEASAHTAVQKQLALEQAQALQGDEAGSVEFILHCNFADARLLAAENVRSPAALEAVWQGVRNIDRRVARLVHGRLDEARQRELSRQQAQQCIDAAERLVLEPRLLANHVVDLDHAWQIIPLVADEQGAEFARVRLALATRLADQAALQHAVLELVARLRRLAESPEFDAAAVEAALVESSATMASYRAAPEATSVTAGLRAEFVAWHEKLTQRLAMQAATATTGDAIEPTQPSSELAPKIKKVRAPQDPVLLEQFDAARAGLEKSLQEGGLQAAAEFDHALREPALQTLTLSEVQQGQLAALRIELARLQDWARWGGNVSREELLKAAEALVLEIWPPAELAKKVGSLRERWKLLDRSAGHAAKPIWQRFDAACSAAYAPAGAHFKKLSEERAENRAKAVTLLDELNQFVSLLPVPEALDWKKLAQFEAHIKQAWQRLGVMERKEKKQLDGAFTAALKNLTAPLAARRASEIAQREAMIASIAALDPKHRNALDTLRSVQERWQVQAKALPLERKQEQALWLRFRAACDQAFAARKQTAALADGERRAHLQAREALCATLEAAVALPEHEVSALIRDTRAAWDKTGEVPRALEKKIEQRYHAAVAKLTERIELAKRVVRQAHSHALLDKLSLCQKIEASLMSGAPPDAQVSLVWENLPALPAAQEKLVRQRFERALAGGEGYIKTLHANQAILARELLRMEISLHLDSPADAARERLQLQVEVLQASLKAGQKQASTDAQCLALCALAAPPTPEQAQRLQRIIARVL